jgi:hypothetical protein
MDWWISTHITAAEPMRRVKIRVEIRVRVKARVGLK